MSSSHLLGGLTHILNVAGGAGDNIDHPPGQAVVFSSYIVFPSSFRALELVYAFLHSATAIKRPKECHCKVECALLR